MRKLVYSLTNSLDNFIARADGAYDWLLMGDEVASELTRFFASIDTVLMGRKTYDITQQNTPEPGQETSGYMGMKSYVFSRSTQAPPDAGVTIVSENAGEVVRNLKNDSGKDIWLMGGGILAASLLRERLVDVIDVTIQPILLGSGIPLFPDLGLQVDLQLLECKSYKNGLVSLSYRVKN